MLAHTKFFGGGHKWSGLDPERLGAKTRYVGRGRVARPAHPGQDPGDRAAGPTRRRGEGLMPNFAAIGNDLYTGKRSIDFIGRQKTWYASPASSSPSPSWASSPAG